MSEVPFGLAAITFGDYDAPRVEQEVIAAYEAIADTTLYPGDPVRLFLEALAYIVVQQRYIIDWSAKQNLLAYSQGQYLEHLGALLDVARLGAATARTTLRFGMAAPLDWPVVVPASTRATPDGVLHFATEFEAVLAPGQLWVEVPALCRTPGAAGNGYLPGQINKLVDPVAHIVAVVNTTVSLGGADPETDGHLRERIHLAPEKFSVAGPDGAYLYWALTAHQDIVDVGVWSPEPGLVDVRPLLVGGELPTPEILAAVTAVLSDRRVRPLTDQLMVQAPSVAPYDLEVHYWLHGRDAALAGQLAAAVQAAALDWVAWQRAKLGRDINPTRLIARMHQAGAKRVDVLSPVFTPLAVWQVAREGTVQIVYAGLEDE